jgi:hypothetical protein
MWWWWNRCFRSLINLYLPIRHWLRTKLISTCWSFSWIISRKKWLVLIYMIWHVHVLTLTVWRCWIFLYFCLLRSLFMLSSWIQLKLLSLYISFLLFGHYCFYFLFFSATQCQGLFPFEDDNTILYTYLFIMFTWNIYSQENVSRF